MSVIRTDQWLLDPHNKPTHICEKLKVYFEGGVQVSDIYEYLTLHGMYRHPLPHSFELIRSLQRNKVWNIVQKEKRRLQHKWQGPNIPIFIFPSDPNNREMKRKMNGKSGLAFKDKLFLFLSENNTKKEIQALFTHEYNHVCRLTKYPKKEKDHVLLDTVILEGLAENAVHERFGERFIAAWTSLYSNKKLEKIWNNLILPNRNISNFDPKQKDIMYGLRFYPKMSGYCVGYYLVKKYIEVNHVTSKDLFNTPSELIAQINSSSNKN